MIKKENLQIVFKSLIPQGGLLGIAIVWILISPSDNVIEFYSISIKNLIGGLVIGVILAFAGYGYYFMAKKIKPLYPAVELFETVLAPIFRRFGFAEIIILSLVSSFCEETFFRGVLYPNIGIVLSSIGFGLLHLPHPRYWIYAVWAACSGALFAYLFSISGTLVLPITAHAVNNVVGMLLLKKLKLPQAE